MAELLLWSLHDFKITCYMFYLLIHLIYYMFCFLGFNLKVCVTENVAVGELNSEIRTGNDVVGTDFGGECAALGF